MDARKNAEAPRTRHVNADGTPRYTNRLAQERSPYLLQHAHNPVNWFAWGEEAFERARRTDRPVFLSIGYSTCHWCHVMEHESFEDEEVARFLNEHFVPIKVDREERPDVDDVYMTVVNLLTGRGGWPMTVVMTPDQRPFFAGTYFPARDGDRGGSPGLLSILRDLSTAWSADRDGVVTHASEVSRHLSKLAMTPPGALPDAAAIENAALGELALFDVVNGGFGGAPKFPRPVVLELLLRHHRRRGDGNALTAVVRTLEAMHAGGVYDHVAGGFHRYATDHAWQIPHFEKMLYDNAQLAVAYLEAWQVTGNAEHARVAREILDALDRDFSDVGGGFHSATDADSPTPAGHDEEGWFFTWTPTEIDEVLGAERGLLVRQYFGVSERGNFEGRNVLHLARAHDAAAAALHLAPAALRTDIDAAREVLRAARARRPAPRQDDKVLTSWNGLAIGAFARVGFALGEPRYLERAARAATFLLEHHRAPDGTLLRSSRGGSAQVRAFLDDHAFLIAGLLDLFEATGQGRWLDAAMALQRQQDAGFADAADGGYFSTSTSHEALLVRQKPIEDGAEPSGNSVAALNLVRLAALTSNDTYRARALGTLASMGRRVRGAPLALCALDFALDDVAEIVVVAPDAAAAAPLLDVVRTSFQPNRVLVTVLGAAPPGAPIAQGKVAIDGAATAYVCHRGTCERPARDAETLRRQLAPPPAR